MEKTEKIITLNVKAARPDKIEVTGYIIPVPYKVIDNVEYFVGVELKSEDFARYINTGEGKLDLDYIISVRPYKNCPVDDYLRSLPNFVDDPCLKETDVSDA